MNTDGTVNGGTKIDGTDPLLVTDTADQFGWSVTSLGDLDGDGVPDIAVGERHSDMLSTNEGAVYIIFLTKDGEVKDYNRLGHSGIPGVTDSNHDDYLGSSVTAI